MRCNKGPHPDLNQGCCGYLACIVTIQLPRWSQLDVFFILSCCVFFWNGLMAPSGGISDSSCIFTRYNLTVKASMNSLRNCCQSSPQIASGHPHTHTQYLHNTSGWKQKFISFFLLPDQNVFKICVTFGWKPS